MDDLGLIAAVAGVLAVLIGVAGSWLRWTRPAVYTPPEVPEPPPRPDTSREDAEVERARARAEAIRHDTERALDDLDPDSPNPYGLADILNDRRRRR